MPPPHFEYHEGPRQRGSGEIGLNQVYNRFTEATNRLTEIRVELFDGGPESDIVNWLERYEDMALARRWDELAKKEQLPSFFTGAARYWLSAKRRRQLPPDVRIKLR